jgi:CelD/BcsL family acetyltransferase involved in cellulose biosynthesis
LFQIRVAKTIHELDRLRSRWQGLLTPEHTVFQSFAWSRMAMAMFSSTATPHVVVAESDSGTAIIPAVVGGGGSYVGMLGEALFDYRDVLAEGDGSVLRRAWSEIAALDLPLSFFAVRGESARQRWSEFEPQPFCNALYASPADCPPVDFVARHSRLAHRARRLGRKGITLQQYDGTAAELLRTIYERKALQPTPGGNLFLDPQRREFMLRIAAAEPSLCDVFTYETAGELVAALVSFRHNDTRHFYTTYYDLRWADLSPGQLLIYEVTSRSLGEGLRSDYMTGEYPFKARVATGAVPLFKIHATPEMVAAVAAGTAETQTLAA